MKMITTLSRFPRFRQTLSTVAAAGIALALTGCTLSTTAPSTDPFNSTGAMTGRVHGGQQPIYNATVTLYEAGTGGYGSAATPLATAMTNANGQFQFTKLANGATGTGSSWSCPASDPDPQIYLVSSGGNTQGTGVTATNNSAAALIAALGPCSGISTSTEVLMNEVTSVATIYALAQYINPGTTPGTESVGTNGANTGSSTPQGAVGLNNAVSTIQNLATISTGQPVASQTYTGSNMSVTGVTVTATPEEAKIVTIANAIAACINSTAASSTPCTELFAAATPPATASVTSQPSVTFGTAQDTIQAAYYMAVNPTNAGTQVTTTNCPGSTSNISCLFNLTSTTPPFVGGLSTPPTDWTVGVTFTSTGTCAGGNTWQFIDAPAKEAVDGAGNIWFISGISTGATFAGMSPVGQPLACEGYGSVAGLIGAGVAVDPSGNIWASYSGVTSGLQSILELPAGTIATATAGTRWPIPWTSYGLAIDGSGDIFYSGGSHSSPAKGGLLNEFPAPGAATYTTISSGTTYAAGNVFNSTLIGDYTGSGTGDTGTSIIAYMAVAHNGTVWMINQTNELVQNAVPTSLAVSSYAIGSGNTVTFYTSTAPPSTIVTGLVVNVTGLTTSNGLLLDNQSFTVSSVSTVAPYSVTGTMITSANPSGAVNYVPPYPTLSAAAQTSDTGTLVGYTENQISQTATGGLMFGAAVDASGNLYTGSTCCTASGDKELIRYAPGTGSSSLTATNSAAYIGGNNGIRSVALDGAGNVWFGSVYPSTGTAGSSATNMVGEAYWNGSGFTALSPAGTTPATCSSSSQTCPTGGGFVKSSFAIATDLAIDPSGNLWVPASANYSSGTLTANGTNITEVVGAAVPVATPLSVAAGNGTLATKP
jgi:hypothetical protein